ncbi:hypothetical protein V8C35DRAFT_301933 [Trichoderma chlorosporum]
MLNGVTETPANNCSPRSSVTASSLPSLCSTWSPTASPWLAACLAPDHLHLRLWQRQFGRQLRQCLLLPLPRRLPCSRATAYTVMTWIFLLFSSEPIDLRRSFFDMHKGFGTWGVHRWGNRFLFIAIATVFFFVFPTLYTVYRG